MGLQLSANTEIEAKLPNASKTLFLLGAFFPPLFRFLNCRAFIKERKPQVSSCQA
jgi:hypothetical protein